MHSQERRRINKARYRQAREQAEALIAEAWRDGDQRLAVRVAPHAAVQLVEGGAFIEAILWVPDPETEEHGRKETSDDAEKASAPAPQV